MSTSVASFQLPASELFISEFFPIFTDPDLYIAAQAIYEGKWDNDFIWIMKSAAIVQPFKTLRGSSPQDRPLRLGNMHIEPLQFELEATTTALYGFLQSQARILRSVLTDPDDPFILTGRNNLFGFRSPRFSDRLRYSNHVVTTLPQLSTMTLEQFQEALAGFIMVSPGY